jgi:hypothetical protein
MAPTLSWIDRIHPIARTVAGSARSQYSRKDLKQLSKDKGLDAALRDGFDRGLVGRGRGFVWKTSNLSLLCCGAYEHCACAETLAISVQSP